MKVFSFRAECQADIDEFRTLLTSLDLSATLTETPLTFGEVAAEIQIDMTLDELRKTMSSQVDSHVMIQTLREIPLANNNLERDYSIPF
jgi:hypothetical protein